MAALVQGAVTLAEGRMLSRAGELVASLETDLDGILRPALRDVRADLLDKVDSMLLKLEIAERGRAGG